MISHRRQLPLAVVIATHNRCEELATSLSMLQEREPVGEIIVVDNASKDQTVETLHAQFPEVRLIQMPENVGVPAFEIGLRAARHPYVFLLDDDAVPEPGALSRVVEVLDSDPRVAVVACHIVDSSGDAVTCEWPKYPLLFWGCGACLRRESVEGLPYIFDSRLLLHGTEMDLSIRLYSRGDRVRYDAGAAVRHRFSPLGRCDARRIHFLVQSAMWFGMKHLSVRYGIPAVCRHLAVLFCRAVSRRCLITYLTGIASALAHAREILRERRPAPATVERTYLDQVWEYEPLSRRLLRALTGSPASRRSGPMVGFFADETEAQ